MIQKVMNFLAAFWQFPQFLLGSAARRLFFARHREDYKGIPVYEIRSNFISGFAAGPMIFLNHYHFVSEYVYEISAAHEYGHCIQSRFFGPLYLILVGIPSVTWNLLSRVNPVIRKNYYKLYPENWADKLGGLSDSRPWRI